MANDGRRKYARIDEDKTNRMMKVISWEKENALRAMEADLLWLLNEGESRRYKWTSTKRDLVEFVHVVWLRDVVYDSVGRVLPFTYLLRKVCDIVGVAEPKKPTAMLDTIAHRKNQEKLCITHRYMRILQDMQHMQHPAPPRPILRFMEPCQEQGEHRQAA